MFAKSKVTQSMLDAVNSVIVEDEKKRLINDAEMDETGFHKAAHAAKKSGQSHFEFQGKKYPVTAKSHKEAIEMDEASLKIPTATGTKVLGGSGYGSKKAHDAQHKNPFEKGPTKKDLKGIKAPSKKELKQVGENTFAAKLLNHITENKAASPEEIFTDNNLGEEEMTDKQMKKREKIVLSMKKGEPGFKQRYGKNWKNVMYATATKQAMKEDSSDTWNGSYDFLVSEEVIDLPIDPQTGELMDDYEVLVSGDTTELKKNQRMMLEEGDAQYKKMDPKKPFKKMSDVVDRKKTVKDLMKGRQYFGTGKVKEEVELNEDESLDSIAKKHGMEYKKTTYGAGMKHKTKGEISINRYGEWHHYPAGSKSSKAHGSSDNNFASLDKHLSSMKEEVELEEAAPKKMDDVMRGKQNLEPAKKGVVGTVKSDLKNFGRFLAGKKETNEAVEIATDKSAEKITTDTLAGRVAGGKLNSFRNFKVNLTTSGEESIPKEIEQGEDTKEKQKISTNPGPVDIKLDDKLTGPTPHTHFAKKENITTEEVRGELKKIRSKEAQERNKEVGEFNKKVTQKEEVEVLDEDRWLVRYLLSKGINPKFINRNQKVSHAKSDEFHKWKRDHQTIQGEEVEVPFDKPYKTVKKPDVKDKSGAVHTPMSRARDLAKQAFKKVKNETLMGKAGATSESKKKW